MKQKHLHNSIVLVSGILIFSILGVFMVKVLSPRVEIAPKTEDDLEIEGEGEYETFVIMLNRNTTVLEFYEVLFNMATQRVFNHIVLKKSEMETVEITLTTPLWYGAWKDVLREKDSATVLHDRYIFAVEFEDGKILCLGNEFKPDQFDEFRKKIRNLSGRRKMGFIIHMDSDVNMFECWEFFNFIYQNAPHHVVMFNFKLLGANRVSIR